MTLYAESSAVLAWLLGESKGDKVRVLLSEAAGVFTSVLTLVETDRVLIRAHLSGGLSEANLANRRGWLARAHRHWHLLQLHEEVLDRARQPFPGEPIRTLGALHLASALAARTAVPGVALLTLDDRVRRAAVRLGFEVLPPPTLIADNA